MSDLFWCTHCDSAISQSSKSLYCSEQCLRADALKNHPLLGYTYPEFVDFPRPYSKRTTYSPESLLSTTTSSSSASNKDSAASIHTVPTLSTCHSSCQSSPTLSALNFTGTTIPSPPPLLHLPPTLSTTATTTTTTTTSSSSSTPSKHSMPSFLLMGASNATTALSRPSILDYRPSH
ncbi:hypothetical protein BCR42DRAFT_420971 [Absidia repens]|uniref:Uncharacterized protein n=1 Tax=Absidia repens TaxID=90262 RepID=A0A1X2I962_9FUNG|nr:hypothetical protein BCR42DRAFT_420971 [Absidia repens]